MVSYNPFSKSSRDKREIFPRQTAKQYPLSRENEKTHAPRCTFEWGWGGTWLSCGSYGVFVAITESAWLLQAARDNISVSATCDPVTATRYPRHTPFREDCLTSCTWLLCVTGLFSVKIATACSI